MRLKGVLGWLTVLVVAAALLIGGGAWLSSSLRGALAPGLSFGCTATVNGAAHKLALDQSENAALISALSYQRGMPARAASIALATALQESKLRNIDYGDLDSVGLFQQRPSQGWGTVEEIMDPVYSTQAFYDVLAQLPDYANLPINDAAQIVQRSGHPQAYAQHEALSRAFASALTGQTPQAFSCTLPASGGHSAPETIMAAAQTALGALPMHTGGGGAEGGGAEGGGAEGGGSLVLEVSETTGWMAAHWAVANAQQFGIETVSYGGQVWDRNANAGTANVGWQAADSAVTGQVSITLAPDAKEVVK